MTTGPGQSGLNPNIDRAPCPRRIFSMEHSHGLCRADQRRSVARRPAPRQKLQRARQYTPSCPGSAAVARPHPAPPLPETSQGPHLMALWVQLKRQWPFWRSRPSSPERIPWLCCPAGCPGSWFGSPRRRAEPSRFVRTGRLRDPPWWRQVPMAGLSRAFALRARRHASQANGWA